jgi:hypothetical protein
MRDQTKPVVVENGYIKVSLNSYLISDYTKFEVSSIINEKKSIWTEVKKFIPKSIPMRILMASLFAIAISEFLLFRPGSMTFPPRLNPFITILAVLGFSVYAYIKESEETFSDIVETYHLCISNKSGKFYIYSSSDKSEIEKYIHEIHLCASSRSSVSS